MLAKRSYDTYSEVPWYRRNWFVITSFLLWPLWPALVAVLVTGDVYWNTTTGPRKYSFGGKAAILILIFLFIWFAYVIGDSTDWK